MKSKSVLVGLIGALLWGIATSLALSGAISGRPVPQESSLELAPPISDAELVREIVAVKFDTNVAGVALAITAMIAAAHFWAGGRIVTVPRSLASAVPVLHCGALSAGLPASVIIGVWHHALFASISWWGATAAWCAALIGMFGSASILVSGYRVGCRIVQLCKAGS